MFCIRQRSQPTRSRSLRPQAFFRISDPIFIVLILYVFYLSFWFIIIIFFLVHSCYFLFLSNSLRCRFPSSLSQSSIILASLLSKNQSTHCYVTTLRIRYLFTFQFQYLTSVDDGWTVIDMDLCLRLTRQPRGSNLGSRTSEVESYFTLDA